MGTIARQEEALAVGCLKQAAVLALLGGPGACGIVNQLVPLLSRRHAPFATPIGPGRVVRRLQNRKAVGESFVPFVGFAAILGQLLTVSILAVLVVSPVAVGFCRGFAPSIGIPELFGSVGAKVTGSPQRAAWQTKVDVLWALGKDPATRQQQHSHHKHE